MSLPVVLQRVKTLGYQVFDGAADYDLNIVAVRSKDDTANVFNDLITATYKVKGQWFTRSWQCTTDPGLYWLRNPGNVKGTALLVPGQYKGVYKLDKHAGKYLALCQRNGPVKVYRDADGSDHHSALSGSVDEGFFGINIHRASYRRASTQVDRWSAGCTVFANPDDFAELIKLCKKQVETNGWESFTYTLLEEW